ncbi:MAG: hypothetical protein P4L77_09675 [Sulfuriferula sp.]|nr:hypothetical protein [Sulfuriferula sp.]
MRIPMLLIYLLAVAGCDSHVVPPSVPKVEAPQQAQERLFDTQRKALEQAKQVDGKVQQDAAAQRHAIDQQTQ